jgi:hypothetical protein
VANKDQSEHLQIGTTASDGIAIVSLARRRLQSGRAIVEEFMRQLVSRYLNRELSRRDFAKGLMALGFTT